MGWGERRGPAPWWTEQAERLARAEYGIGSVQVMRDPAREAVPVGSGGQTQVAGTVTEADGRRVVLIPWQGEAPDVVFVGSFSFYRPDAVPSDPTTVFAPDAERVLGRAWELLDDGDFSGDPVGRARVLLDLAAVLDRR